MSPHKHTHRYKVVVWIPRMSGETEPAESVWLTLREAEAEKREYERDGFTAVIREYDRYTDESAA